MNFNFLTLQAATLYADENGKKERYRAELWVTLSMIFTFLIHKMIFTQLPVCWPVPIEWVAIVTKDGTTLQQRDDTNRYEFLQY